jgi:hypothetical protein
MSNENPIWQLSFLVYEIPVLHDLTEEERSRDAVYYTERVTQATA